ncbi:DNA-3-methyladenine glycosylase I [Friedmanniella luteola]|uniref:DNA-3-methyladenine glycosylase I n=1 Tax=Friedmanniella luteola TaxID=546871 RepID=A0A1H1NJB8_9ACTN|nr:DNA-3-methyladenine glycosylase I [Friedmanniella luteola]SDR98419.1 DNA-3-methyladenine glycosylase I [Friedmanniella luteola]
MSVLPGPDGRLRCAWALGAPDYLAYHDDEWGRPVTSVSGLYERLTLEAFQSGLAWITILRKREGFRQAFAGFDPAVVAGFGEADVERLMADPGIVRNRAKIEAAVANARVVDALGAEFAELVLGYRQPDRPRPAPDQVPASTPASAALAKALKAHGIRFVGPTTAYALMQAVGLVDDHVQGCSVVIEG